MTDEQLTDLCCAVSHSPRMQYVAREARHEILTGRLAEDDLVLLAEVRGFIQEQIDGGADTCGQHRLQLAALDRLLERKP